MEPAPLRDCLNALTTKPYDSRNSYIFLTTFGGVDRSSRDYFTELKQNHGTGIYIQKNTSMILERRKRRWVPPLNTYSKCLQNLAENGKCLNTRGNLLPTLLCAVYSMILKKIPIRSRHPRHSVIHILNSAMIA